MCVFSSCKLACTICRNSISGGASLGENVKHATFRALRAGIIAAPRIVLLRRNKDGRITALSEDRARAEEFHDDTFTRATSGFASTDQTNQQAGGFMGCEEHATLNEQNLASSDIVTHNGSITTGEEHAVGLAVIAVHVRQEPAFTGDGTTAAHALAGNAKTL